MLRKTIITLAAVAALSLSSTAMAKHRSGHGGGGAGHGGGGASGYGGGGYGGDSYGGPPTYGGGPDGY
jgi:hypothetical protein